MWLMGEIPQELGWTVLLIIPKTSIDTKGIGLLENLLMVVEEIIDTHICASIHFHGVLHNFQSGRRRGMAITELKIAQELSIVDCKPLLLVFLILSNMYDTVNRGRLIWNLEVYIAGPCLFELLETFQFHQKVVLR